MSDGKGRPSGWAVAGLIVAVAVVGWWAWAWLTRTSHHKDVVYGTGGGEPLSLDLLLPEAGRSPYPVAVYVPPLGTWHRDELRDRQTRTALDGFRGRGWAVAVLHYRSPDAARFPAPIADVKTAVRWARAKGPGYGLDPGRVAVVGVSLGGYVSAVVGTTAAADGLEGDGGHPDASSRPDAVVVAAAPLDLATKTWPDFFETRQLVPFLGARYADKPDAYRKASPATYASADDPPFLILHSTADPRVPFGHAERLHAALRKAGAASRLVSVDSKEHVWEGESLERVVGQVVDHLAETLPGR